MACDCSGPKGLGNLAQALAWVGGSILARSEGPREKMLECIMMSGDYERAGIPVLWHSTGLSDRTPQNTRSQAKAWAKLPRPFGPIMPNVKRRLVQRSSRSFGRRSEVGAPNANRQPPIHNL